MKLQTATIILSFCGSVLAAPVRNAHGERGIEAPTPSYSAKPWTSSWPSHARPSGSASPHAKPEHAQTSAAVHGINQAMAASPSKQFSGPPATQPQQTNVPSADLRVLRALRPTLLPVKFKLLALDMLVPPLDLRAPRPPRLLVKLLALRDFPKLVSHLALEVQDLHLVRDLPQVDNRRAANSLVLDLPRVPLLGLDFLAAKDLLLDPVSRALGLPLVPPPVLAILPMDLLLALLLELDFLETKDPRLELVFLAARDPRLEPSFLEAKDLRPELGFLAAKDPRPELGFLAAREDSREAKDLRLELVFLAARDPRLEPSFLEAKDLRLELGFLAARDRRLEPDFLEAKDPRPELVFLAARDPRLEPSFLEAKDLRPELGFLAAKDPRPELGFLAAREDSREAKDLRLELGFLAAKDPRPELGFLAAKDPRPELGFLEAKDPRLEMHSLRARSPLLEAATPAPDLPTVPLRTLRCTDSKETTYLVQISL
ncbi:hypothetical protein BO70DRAFT_397562 [Aspergillus heteromorphus CBS 117.55]|uniref:Uncharacterized protein n=1 Tax=Aspergillus heteromorphus CBS 117.55 TaxID=1448321 RepID=A0A317VYB3_9EURO|nr:uncharacterized protein BO70DRAFT_397562 [Aspergillus heteromorphus CBS 117.55]PWY78321.1 hypothetical protein BO70DRAFT_397562 [Aspergillus heteromorphus CBS 117.55]